MWASLFFGTIAAVIQVTRDDIFFSGISGGIKVQAIQ